MEDGIPRAAVRTSGRLRAYPASLHAEEEDTGTEEDTPHSIPCVPDEAVVQIDNIEEYGVREGTGTRRGQLTPPLFATEAFFVP